MFFFKLMQTVVPKFMLSEQYINFETISSIVKFEQTLLKQKFRKLFNYNRNHTLDLKKYDFDNRIHYLGRKWQFKVDAVNLS